MGSATSRSISVTVARLLAERTHTNDYGRGNRSIKARGETWRNHQPRRVDPESGNEDGPGLRQEVSGGVRPGIELAARGVVGRQRLRLPEQPTHFVDVDLPRL